MKSAVIVFPGSNCDRDLATAFEQASGHAAEMVWHKETSLPSGLDVVGIPGGFSYGDYLRCGAIAAQSPIMAAVAEFAAKGGHVIGICNGFQVLIESGLLPGALLRNAGIKFVCRNQSLRVATSASPFTDGYTKGEAVTFPIAHHDGNFHATDDVLKTLEDADRVAFRYDGNPNGSAGDIAGILSENRRVLGLMPHPERAVDPATGLIDGARMFKGLAEQMVAA